MVFRGEKISVSLAVGAVVTSGFLSFMAANFLSGSKGGYKNEPKAILDCILQRRSVFPKQYSEKKVDKSVVEEMLEAARWAPTHNLTEPWKFIVFSSKESLEKLGEFLATQYKESCSKSGKQFSEAKYKKKASNALKSSFVIALVCDAGNNKNPMVEEICSVAMAVQNMHLIATAHGVGAYWSSSAVHEKKGGNMSPLVVINPQPTREYLELKDTQVCLGWMFVGSCDKATWKNGRRRELNDSDRLAWK